ncbi:hypothetical protein ACIGDI_34625 [Streptomyces sp. NPDC085900]|uniref:hypothetical protein n=1 Tax=Streptomyces sp. NPDC085900 TaxID=3365737 RepID=UPI0037CE7E8E
MDIGTTGIWSPEHRLHLDHVEIREAAAELDQQGWGPCGYPVWAATTSVTPNAFCAPPKMPPSSPAS